MNNETPRTDAAKETIFSDQGFPVMEIVEVEFAELLERENNQLREGLRVCKEALESAKSSGEYVVKLVEATGKSGLSPNPNERADWLGTSMHCYAAMAFVSSANIALSHPAVQAISKDKQQ